MQSRPDQASLQTELKEGRIVRYLVTGGAGFIGSNIVEELLRRGDRARVLDNFSTGRRSNVEPFRPDIELIEGDIRDMDTVQRACQDVDYVLHQAALPSVPRSIADPMTTNAVNVGGSVNVLRAAVDNEVRRVVSASSSSVYGNSETLPKHEEMVPSPLSPYAVSKLALEAYSRAFNNCYRLEVVCLRYFNVFGPRQNPKSQYAAVIPKFLRTIRDNQRPTIFGDGEQSRDFTPVANVVAANIAACTAPIEGFLVSNVGAGKRYTLKFLVSELCRLLGRSVEPMFDPPRPGDVKHSLASIRVLTEKLGVRRLVSFPEGLAQLATQIQ